MAGLALAIVLAAAALIMVTVIICQTQTDIAKIRNGYTGEMAKFATEIGRAQKEIEAIRKDLDSAPLDKISDMKLDITQLRMKAGL